MATSTLTAGVLLLGGARTHIEKQVVACPLRQTGKNLRPVLGETCFDCLERGPKETHVCMFKGLKQAMVALTQGSPPFPACSVCMSVDGSGVHESVFHSKEEGFGFGPKCGLRGRGAADLFLRVAMVG